MPMVNMSDYLSRPEYQEYLQQVNGLSPKLPQRKKRGALRTAVLTSQPCGSSNNNNSSSSRNSSRKIPLKRKLRLGSAVDASIGDGTRHFLSCYSTFLPFESTLKMFIRLLQEQLWVSESRQRLILDELEGDWDVAETQRLKDQAERFLQVPVEFMLKRYKEVVHAFRQLKSSSCPYYLIENCLVGLCQLMLRIYPENDELPDDWFMLNSEKRALIEKSVTVNAQFLTKLKEYELADILPENLNHVIRLSRLGILEETGRLGNRVDQSVVCGVDPLCPLSINLDSPCTKSCKKYPTCSKQWRNAQFNEATQRYIAQVYNQKSERVQKPTNPSPAESEDDEGTGSISSENFPDSECTWPAELFSNDPFPETSFLALLQRVVPKKRRACPDLSTESALPADNIHNATVSRGRKLSEHDSTCIPVIHSLTDGSEKDSGMSDSCRHESDDITSDTIKNETTISRQFTEQATQTANEDFDCLFPDLPPEIDAGPLSPLALPTPSMLPNMFTDIDSFFQPVQTAPITTSFAPTLTVPTTSYSLGNGGVNTRVSPPLSLERFPLPTLKRARSSPSPTPLSFSSSNLNLPPISVVEPKMAKHEDRHRRERGTALQRFPSISSIGGTTTMPTTPSEIRERAETPPIHSVSRPPNTPSPVQQIKDDLIESSHLIDQGYQAVLAAASYMPPTPPSVGTPTRTLLPAMTPVTRESYTTTTFANELPPELAAAIEAARCAPSPPPPIYLEAQTPIRLGQHRVIEISQTALRHQSPIQTLPSTAPIYSSPRPKRSPEATRSPHKYREYEIITPHHRATRTLSHEPQRVATPIRPTNLQNKTLTPQRLKHARRQVVSPIRISKPKVVASLPKGLPKKLPEILPEIDETECASDEEIELDFKLDDDGNLIVDEEALKNSSSMDDRRYSGIGGMALVNKNDLATIEIGDDFPSEASYVVNETERNGVLGLWRHHQITGKGKYWTLKDTISLLIMSKIFGAGQYATIKDLDLPRFKRFNRREIKARFNNLEKRRIVLRLNDDKSRFFINHPQLSQVVDENEARQRIFIKRNPQIYPKKSLGPKYAKLSKSQF